MKTILPLLFAAVAGLASCSKNDDPQAAAAPSLLGTWSFQSKVKVTTPRNGTAASSVTTTSPGSYTLNFGTNGTLTSTTGTTTASNPYTYAGQVITITTPSTNGPKVQTLTVTELTANRLVTVELTEDTPNRYTTTDTYSR